MLYEVKFKFHSESWNRKRKEIVFGIERASRFTTHSVKVLRKKSFQRVLRDVVVLYEVTLNGILKAEVANYLKKYQRCLI